MGLGILGTIKSTIAKVTTAVSPTAIINKTPAKTGNVVIQPKQPAALFYPPVVVGGSQGGSVNSVAKTVTSKAPEATKPDKGQNLQVEAPSIAKAREKLAESREQIFVNPKGNQAVADFEKSKLHEDIKNAPEKVIPVIPPFKSKLTYQKLHVYENVKSVQSFDKLVSDTKKFEPYELLTGISQERPELILLADFEPLFLSNSTTTTTTNSATQTNVLAFFQAQLFLRELQSVLIKKQLTFSADPKMQKELKDRKQAFYDMITKMSSTSNTLASTITLLENLKSSLNIKTSVGDVEFADLAAKYVKRFASAQNLIDYVNSTHPTKYSIVDVLTLFGFSRENVVQNFSSTKIWMQLLIETKHTLLTHSARFQDRGTSQQAADNNAVTLKSFNYEVVALKSPQLKLVSFFDIRHLQLDGLPRVLKILTDAYLPGRLYTSLNVSSTTNRVAALLNIVSKEYRYSVGLGNETVKKTLETYYGSTKRIASLGNKPVFDDIFGKIGNNITDFSTVVNNSLVSYAQIQARAASGQASNVGILTLESKYVDGIDGTLTPGSEYYIDSILRLNGSKLDVGRLFDLAKIASTAYTNFSTITRGLNFLVDTSKPDLVSAKTVKEAISDPRVLLNTMSSMFLDSNGKLKNEIYYDMVGSLFEAAESNLKIRSLLFLYFMTRITRSYKVSIPTTSSDELDDNSHTTEEIINQLMNELDVYGKNAAAANATDELQEETTKNKQQLIVRYLVKITLRETLQKGSSAIIKVVEPFLNEIATSFIDNAFEKEETGETTFSRFSGSIDTSVMLAVFDTIVILVRRYTAQVITGISDGSTTDNYYVVSQIIVNSHKSFVLGVSNLLVKEITLTQQAIFSILNVLNKHVQMLSNATNFLTSKTTAQVFTDLSTIVTDKEAFQALMSEQQISLLSSTIADLSDLLKQHTSKSERQRIDVDNNNLFTNTDEIVILDQGLVSERLRDAAIAFFSLPDYSRSTSNNKKIISVGIPTGFMHRLNQRVNVRDVNASFENRQNDIVTVNVYKINMENTHIIFRPQKFMFELSRFPVRSIPVFSDDSGISSIDNTSPGIYQIDDILRVIPTRTFGTTTNPLEIEFFNPKNASLKTAFASEDYSFLTNDQKKSIYKNHVTSLLLETYMNVMTGIRTSEFHFPITDSADRFIEPEMTKTIIKKSLDEIIQKNSTVQTAPSKNGTLFSKNVNFVTELASYNTKPPENVSIQTKVNNLPAKNVSAAQGAVRAAAAITSIASSVSNHTAVSKQLLQPKKFDRVFNIIFDPDDFEIDVDQTMSTSEGRTSYAFLLKNNYLDLKPKGTELISEGEHARIKERDKNSGDVIFDKYFIAIETFGETV